MIIRRESGISYFGSTCFTKYQSDVDFDNMIEIYSNVHIMDGVNVIVEKIFTYPFLNKEEEIWYHKLAMCRIGAGIDFSDLKSLKLDKQQSWIFSDIVEVDDENTPVGDVLIDQSVNLKEFKESEIFQEIVRSVF